MTNMKKAEDMANELVTATNGLPKQHDPGFDQDCADAIGVDFTNPIAVQTAIC